MPSWSQACARAVHPHARGEYEHGQSVCRCLDTVHPHARGEYASRLGHGVKQSGSPPRTWGIRHASGASMLDACRFTPTHVGNTRTALPTHRRPAVHPHARGEYHVGRCSTHGLPRFTPTHVGNTTRSAARAAAAPVHPHARGEYRTRCIEPFEHRGGSPPRTWGIRRRDDVERRAGTVHPHARGEYDASRARRHAQRGSPPRTWGIRRAAVARPIRLDRFTPTHVGNTSIAAESTVGDCGSPPRTWGIRSASAVRPARGIRFTPTHVGNRPAVADQ